MRAPTRPPVAPLDRRAALLAVDEHCSLIGAIEDAQSDIRSALIDSDPDSGEGGVSDRRRAAGAYKAAQRRHADAVCRYLEFCIERGELDDKLGSLALLVGIASLK